MTTPYKQSRRRFHSNSRPSNNISMPLFHEEQLGDDAMVTSPPREKKMPNSRLFDDDPSPSLPTLRRLEFAPGSSTSTESGTPLQQPSDPTSPYPGRKRPNGHLVNREHALEDSDEEMFVSPRSSPAYRTMDGRMVTSKNPFSPYTPDTMADASHASPIKTPPALPLSLPSDDASSLLMTGPTIEGGAPVKINLRRRDQATAPFKPNYFCLSRNGFPSRSGQYSFTGSPIEEVEIAESDMSDTVGRKVRKLHLEDTVRSGDTRRNNRLFVDTKEANDTCIIKDETSPTDVMNFPPPTPSKASRAVSGYTPLRSATPRTPTMERRTSARRPFISDDEGDDMMGLSATKRKSRFQEDFDVIGQLGDGSFGTVYKCLSRLDGCMYAVKAAKRKAKGVSDRDRMLKEVYALAALSDQADTAAFHIVRYHQAWMDENRLYIQTELCSSTLQAEMAREPLKEQRRYKLLREILLALEFIHRNGMVHLDIKPENIFIKNDQFKLGDFGLVSKVTNNNDVEEGDSRYMSMELLSGDHTDLTKSDIFSLGATMYEVCLGQQLPTDGPEWQNIRAGTLKALTGTPFALELMIKQMMNPIPQQRPNPSDMLKRRELLSEEQKQLIAEKYKVLEANMALALQTQRMKKLTPPRSHTLTRANTWTGT